MKISTLIAAVTAGFSCAVVAQTERDLESHEHGHALLNVAIDSDLLFIELDTPWNNLVGFEHKPSNSEQQSLVDNALDKLNTPNEMFDFEGATCTIVETTVENNLSEDTGEHHDEEHHDEEHAEDKHGDEEHHDEEHAEDKHGDEEHHDEEHAEDKHGDEEHHDEEHAEDKHGDEEHHDDEHVEDKHGDEHHDEEQAEDKHSDEEHHDHDEGGETHSSLRVSYSFACDNINQLKAIDVKLFKLWTGFEELDAQLIGPTGQTATELTSGATRLDVEQIQ